MGLDFGSGGASVDTQAVRSRCRLTTLNLAIRPFWNTRLAFLEPSIYNVDHLCNSERLNAEAIERDWGLQAK